LAQQEPFKVGLWMSNRLRAAQEYRGSVWRRVVITFLRAPSGGSRAPFLAVLALFGCAPAKPPVVNRQVMAEPGGPAYATVAAVRPIGAFGSGIDPQAAIRAAIGVSSAAATRPSCEIVVRTDDGGTLSVIQPNVADLTPGERVLVVPGALPRLVPAPAQGS
jgi:hypothetical protein